MKHIASTLTLLLALATIALATPLHKEQVAADAKWVVHIDVDKLRSTTVGALFKQLLDSKMGGFQKQFDIDLDWNKISALTAYGTGYRPMPDFNGVVLINTELDLRKALDGVIEKMSQDTNDAPASIQKTQQGDVTTYSMKDSMYLSVRAGSPIIIGKSRYSIEKAGEVLAGTSANLASTRTFSEFPDSKKAFFFLAAAEDFNLTDQFPGEGEGSNPKAKILKLADGGRVMLGEEANQLFLDLSLKAKASEVVTQMQQVVQGMIALASLSQTDNQDLQQLAQSAKVFAAGNIVSLQLGYPADKAIQMLNSHMNGNAEHKQRAEGGTGQRKKHKAKANAPPPENPPETDEK